MRDLPCWRNRWIELGRKIGEGGHSHSVSKLGLNAGEGFEEWRIRLGRLFRVIVDVEDDP